LETILKDSKEVLNTNDMVVWAKYKYDEE